MLTVDFIILNEDRHYNNFGFIRNVDTLAWLGFAPVYDSGTSLWYNMPFVGRDMECKPFKPSHDEQIKLVSDLSWFKPERLNGIHEEITEILSAAEMIDEYRGKAIADSVVSRCLKIERL